MKKLLLSFLLLLLTNNVGAQTYGCGGVNFTPSLGLNCLLEPTNPTYGATSVGLVPASSATDIACINGSATRVVRLQYVRVSGSAGTLVNVPVILTKHASADSGGTVATGNALPVPYTLDPSNPTVTATTTAYTANPTINDTSPGYIDNDIMNANTTGTNASGGAVRFDYTGRNFAQAPILRNTAQQVCVNLQSTTISTGSLNVTFRWTELAQ